MKESDAIEKEFQELREKLVPYAQAKKIYTDEDIEKLFDVKL